MSTYTQCQSHLGGFQKLCQFPQGVTMTGALQNFGDASVPKTWVTLWIHWGEGFPVG